MILKLQIKGEELRHKVEGECIGGGKKKKDREKD